MGDGMGHPTFVVSLSSRIHGEYQMDVLRRAYDGSGLLRHMEHAAAGRARMTEPCPLRPD
jgi:hypothetical protein